MDQAVLFAFLLTLGAGLATGLGSVIAFATKKTNRNVLTFSLGFSAGVMIYVSLIEIFQKAQESLIAVAGEKIGVLYTVISFFTGILIVGIIDWLVPNVENPHELHDPEELRDTSHDYKKLKRMGLFTALAIAIHNFPEGLATFVGALSDPNLGIAIAIAIAIHNIPEGIAVSVPIYHATGSRKKAFLYSFLSGIAEPVGALVGYYVLGSLFNELFFGVLFASVAGIMVYISIDELLPAAQKWGKHHHMIYGFIGGMAVMAISLLLFV